ncbi:MAG: DUF6531 domain-containing protein, partial [Actinobacteria bacterium]|nr:DUF6531 domain-containing protein [Actinomycetota bacterium]
MTIDARSGTIEWTPAAGDAGAHLLTVLATDGRGAIGRQAFELRVRESNEAPGIISPAPPSSVLAGTTWQHDFDASDADGDLLRYEIASGPAAMTVQAVTGLVTWKTTAADVGVHAVRLRAVDCCGGAVEIALSIEVEPDTEPPSVEIGFDPNPAGVGAIVRVSVGASDNAVIASRTLMVECEPAAPRELVLDEIGRASFSSPATGYCIFTATATDPSGNETTVVSALQVGDPDDPLDPYPPVVTIHSPTPQSVITAPVDVIMTISDDTEDGAPGSGPLTWAVEVAPAGSDAFETIGSGSGEVASEVLAALDPTMRPNGIYRLRVTGNDGVQIGGLEYEISIAGDLKLGNYTMSFVDLVAMQGGLPIVVSRRYDTLDTSAGDFGAGWRLGLAGEVEDQAVESNTGSGLVDLFAAEPFHPGTRVYVTRPDGRRVGFTFQPRSAGGLVAYAFFPSFDPDPGVEDTLEVVEPAGSFFLFGGNANQIGVPYNPSVYRLKTREGVDYVIDEDEGLRRIEAPDGTWIDVQEDGLFGSTGAATLFERDAAGRITRIVEPADPDDPDPPGELRYSYDETTGNLASFTNQADETVNYYYEDPAFPHYLTRIDDPSGHPAVRTVVDDEGRIVAQCGPDGDPATLEGCVTYDYDVAARLQTVFDGEGNRRDLVFDERGNPVILTFFLDASQVIETRFEYDEGDRLTSFILAGGERWSYSYDERGNLLSITDPAGR